MFDLFDSVLTEYLKLSVNELDELFNMIPEDQEQYVADLIFVLIDTGIDDNDQLLDYFNDLKIKRDEIQS